MQKHTLRALLTQPLQNELGIIRLKAVALWANPQHRTFTDHKPEGHSERIIVKLDAITAELGEAGQQLSSEEAYILLASAYLHDIGMQAGNPKYGTLDEIRDKHHLISQEMILGSVSDPVNFPSLGVGAEFAEEIALVSAAHRKLYLSESRFDDVDKAGGVLRLRLLSALLRLADELDRDYKRVNMDLLKTMQVSQTSRLHWWRCHYISAVSVRNGIITATCEVPDEDYSYLLKISVERELNQELAKVQEFLWPPIQLRVAAVKTKVSTIKKRMSDEDFAVLRSETEQLLVSSSQDAIAEIVRLREREERQAHTTSAEAQRQSGADPPDTTRAITLHESAAQSFFRIGRLQNVADELEQLARLHLEQGDKLAAAERYEQLGQLYLDRDEVFLSRAKFHRAVELTPLLEAADGTPDFRHLKRRLQIVIPEALLGEIAESAKLLDELANLFVNQPFPFDFGQLLFNSGVLFWGLQGEWKYGLGWAQQWVACEDQLWQQLAPENRDAFSYARAFYESSLCASHAGEHELALQWIERAFAIYSDAATTDAGLKFMLHGRRAYIQARRDQWRSATEDFVVALEGAEAMGREDYALACLENAMLTARRANIKLESLEGMAERKSRLRDLQSETWRTQDALKSTLMLDTRQLYDAHSNHLITLHRALSENNWRGVHIVQSSLMKLYNQANRWPQAMGAAIMARINDDAVACAQEFSDRDAESARLAGVTAANLVKTRGNSTDERCSIARVVSALSDLIPDAEIESTATQLLEWCEQEEKRVLAGMVLPFLASVIERLSPQTAAQSFELARRVLTAATDAPLSNEKARHAALRFLARAYKRIPQETTTEWVTLIQSLVKGEDAWLSLGLLACFAEGLGDVSGEAARQFLWDLATANQLTSSETDDLYEKSRLQRRAAHVYLQMKLGALPEDVRVELAQYHQKRIADVGQKAEGQISDGKIKREFVLLDDGNLATFDDLIETFSDEQIESIYRVLFLLAELSESLFPIRQDALAGLLVLLPRLTKSQCAEVARLARECVSQLQIGEMQEWLGVGATDPFSRYKMTMGTPEGVQIFAIDLVAASCEYLDEDGVRSNVSCLLQAASNEDTEVRAMAVGALGAVCEQMTAEEHEVANIQTLLSLQSAEHNTVSQANFTASRLASTLTQSQARLYLRCWNAIAQRGSPHAQISTVRTLHRVLAATGEGKTQFQEQDLTACLKLFENSPSYRARHVAANPDDD